MERDSCYVVLTCMVCGHSETFFSTYEEQAIAQHQGAGWVAMPSSVLCPKHAWLAIAGSPARQFFIPPQHQWFAIAGKPIIPLYPRSS